MKSVGDASFTQPPPYVTRYEKTRLSAGIIILSYGLIITKNLYLGEIHFII